MKAGRTGPGLIGAGCRVPPGLAGVAVNVTNAAGDVTRTQWPCIPVPSLDRMANALAVSSRWAMVRVVYDGVVPMVAIGDNVGTGNREEILSVVMMVMATNREGSQ